MLCGGLILVHIRGSLHRLLNLLSMHLLGWREGALSYEGSTALWMASDPCGIRHCPSLRNSITKAIHRVVIRRPVLLVTESSGMSSMVLLDRRADLAEGR